LRTLIGIDAVVQDGVQARVTQSSSQKSQLLLEGENETYKSSGIGAIESEEGNRGLRVGGGWSGIGSHLRTGEDSGNRRPRWRCHLGGAEDGSTGEHGYRSQLVVKGEMGAR
jgi:hypothetical protein